MIRSTTSTLKYSNLNKKSNLMVFIKEYKKVVGNFIDLIWNIDSIPSLLPKEITSQINTWLSARMVQCAGKQASGIVRGTKVKQKRRLYAINKLKEEKRFTKARKLQKIYDEINISKPNINHIHPELDSRFINIDLNNKTSFDGWIHLSSIGNKIKIDIPFKKSKHFNKLLSQGKLKSGIRLSNKQITFMFDLPNVDKKEKGEVLGIDIGQINVISCSNGHISDRNNHGHDLNSITKKLNRKKKGSKGFKKVQEHRKNYINWTINQLNLENIKEIKIEDIKNLRKGKRTNQSLSHWTYTEIFGKLENRCEVLGVQVTRVAPTYTSQRCSECGWTRRGNRKGKEFRCNKCGFVLDADLNASRNISSNLKPIGYKKRHEHDIRNGFWWHVCGEEPVVPLV